MTSDLQTPVGRLATKARPPRWAWIPLLAMLVMAVLMTVQAFRWSGDVAAVARASGLMMGVVVLMSLQIGRAHVAFDEQGVTTRWLLGGRTIPWRAVRLDLGRNPPRSRNAQGRDLPLNATWKAPDGQSLPGLAQAWAKRMDVPVVGTPPGNLLPQQFVGPLIGVALGLGLVYLAFALFG